MVLLILFDSLSDFIGEFSACAFTCVTFHRAGFLEASPLLGSECIQTLNPKPWGFFVYVGNRESSKLSECLAS